MPRVSWITLQSLRQIARSFLHRRGALAVRYFFVALIEATMREYHDNITGAGFTLSLLQYRRFRPQSIAEPHRLREFDLVLELRTGLELS
jgi:hypothetical protein